MKNGILAIVILGGMFFGCCYLAFRLGGSICREDIANKTNEIQQVVQETDRNITEKVLGAGHRANLAFLLSEFKRAD